MGGRQRFLSARLLSLRYPADAGPLRTTPLERSCAHRSIPILVEGGNLNTSLSASSLLSLSAASSKHAPVAGSCATSTIRSSSSPRLSKTLTPCARAAAARVLVIALLDPQAASDLPFPHTLVHCGQSRLGAPLVRVRLSREPSTLLRPLVRPTCCRRRVLCALPPTDATIASRPTSADHAYAPTARRRGGADAANPLGPPPSYFPVPVHPRRISHATQPCARSKSVGRVLRGTFRLSSTRTPRSTSPQVPPSAVATSHLHH